jgi:ADP-heptose:LPS heptosyltransferase
VSYARPVGREGSWLFANRRAELTPDKLSRFERNAALLRYLAIDPEAGVGSPLSGDAEAAAKLGLEASSGDELVAIHPGTSAATPYKRYTVDGYGMLARELKSRRHSRCIVTFGPAPGERGLADAVVAASDGAAELAPPTEHLSELVALFSLCRLFVGSDSGPLHLAALVGTPVVQVLGPTDPVENAPYKGTPSRSVRVPLACSPCRRGCSAATCMRIVPLERIASAALELLSAQGSPPAHRRPPRTLAVSASPSGL